MAEVGSSSPFFEIGRREDADFESAGVRHDHDPVVLEPGNVRITELGRGGWDDGVAGVLLKGVTAIEGIGDVLRLGLWSVEGVDCNDTVGLVGEESRGVVCIDHDTSTENAFVFGLGREGDLLVGPVVEILGCCVAPMLVSCNNFGWVV